MLMNLNWPPCKNSCLISLNSVSLSPYINHYALKLQILKSNTAV